MEKRSALQKAVLISVAAMAVAFAILTFARGPERTARGSWMLYFTMLLFSALLALDAAYPLVLFRWQHMCDVKDPEPSDFYLGMQRAG